MEIATTTTIACVALALAAGALAGVIAIGLTVDGMREQIEWLLEEVARLK